jgi:hypothetical protein
VKIYPNTSLAMESHQQDKLEKEKMEIDQIGEEIGQEEKKNSKKWEDQQIELSGKWPNGKASRKATGQRRTGNCHRKCRTANGNGQRRR